jgi:LuxR family transcriptional regulator, maltose regulon positive regulatory protein
MTTEADRRLRIPQQARSRAVEGSTGTADTRDAATSAAELGHLLLDAKFSVPQLRQGTVNRGRLVDAARSSDCRVVAVTAPAGYGKSTFLAGWAAAEDRPVAWVSLDRFDDDPANLLASLASAYCRADLGGTALVFDMRSQAASVLARAAPRLAAELRASAPFVLMLDDLHQLQSPACHDVLGLIISAIPRGSQLATASRSEQPHLPRLRAAGEALEVGAGDLALDAAGVQQIFANLQVSPAPELAAAVTERTEGWAVGIYLAALIARESHGQAQTVTGEDRYVADYLYREALLRQPKAIQRFLRRTAVLDQLSGPLCEAVLRTSAADIQLRRIEAHSLFLTPLDRERRWYRYHGLFREFLLRELRRTEPDIIMDLHERAADWYESNGFSGLALEQLLEIGHWHRSVRLAAKLALPTYMAGQLSTVQRWLAALGDANIARYPPLAVLAGWEGVISGDPARAERWAAVVGAASFDGEPASGTSSFDSGRAQLRAGMCASGPEQMMADATFSLAQEPAWSPCRDSVLWMLAEANLLAGHVDEARTHFAEASTTASAMGNWDTIPICESQLAWLAMDRGDWKEAADRLKYALGVIDSQRLDDYVFSLPAFAGAARVSLHQGDLEEARRHLAHAMRARATATYLLPYIAVRLRLHLARVFLAITDLGFVHQLLREIDDILTHRPALGALVDEVGDFRCALESTGASGPGGSLPLTPAELRVLPYLQTHLTAAMIAKRLFISIHTVKTEIKAIYRKLGVSSRDDAVRKATEIGLLGG